MQKLKFLGVDLFLVMLAGIFAYAVRDVSFVVDRAPSTLIPYLGVTLIVALPAFVFGGLHRSVWRYFSFSDGARLVSVVSMALLAVWFVLFALNRADSVPREVPLLHWAFALALLGGARAIVKITRGRVPTAHPDHLPAHAIEYVLLVGLNHITELYLRCATKLAADLLSIVGILDEDKSLRGRSLGFSSVIGEPANIAGIIKQYNIHGITIDRVVLCEAFDDLSEASRSALLAAERECGLVVDLFEERLGFGRSVAGESGFVPAGRDEGPTHATDRKMGLHLTGGFVELSPAYRIVKRLFDIFGASGLLVLLSPLVAMTALLVAFDVGRSLTFWQVRPGRFGKPFKVFKFRTMGPAHDAMGRCIADEKRTSRLGFAIRRSRLDELPQLFNILIGTMSFVGPRPLLPIDQPAFAAKRLSVRPGLTGWAQINGGHAHLGKDDKGAMDLWYVRHASLWLDISILLRTVVFVIRGERPPAGEALAAAHEEVRQFEAEMKSQPLSQGPLRPESRTPSHTGVPHVA